MKRSPSSSLFTTVMILWTASGFAAGIDMDDPFRAVGRENDIRVDAQLMSQIVTPGTPITIRYQIQNLSSNAVAVADKLCAASYDADSRTITLAVGSEIPPDGELPKMATIAPGEKKTFTTAAALRVALPAAASRVVALPRFLQIKVSVLADIAPFAQLLKRQQAARAPVAIPLTDDQFSDWLEANDTIYLNELPIRFQSRSRGNFDASSRHRSGSL